MLHSEPSFCIYADEDANGKGDFRVRDDSGEFSFENNTTGLLVENDNRLSGFQNLSVAEKQRSFNGGGDVEEASNPLFLINYAHLLQSNGDLTGAEEYYFRATMADPENGEILMKYAKLVWKLHHEQDRASAYFERAVRAAPEDCDVLAAYASFLWEIDEDKDTDEECLEVEEKQVSFDLGEYYKKMVIENPSDPLFLENYANFLQQTKGDLEGAELYYSRSVQAGLKDGLVISQYAKLVWELHRDQEKASRCFELAVEAAPADSHVLAAYAKFLWEAEEEEDEPQ